MILYRLVAGLTGGLGFLVGLEGGDVEACAVDALAGIDAAGTHGLGLDSDGLGRCALCGLGCVTASRAGVDEVVAALDGSGNSLGKQGTHLIFGHVRPRTNGVAG